jgi:hypothetical protein
MFARWAARPMAAPQLTGANCANWRDWRGPTLQSRTGGAARATRRPTACGPRGPTGVPIGIGIFEIGTARATPISDGPHPHVALINTFHQPVTIDLPCPLRALRALRLLPCVLSTPPAHYPTPHVTVSFYSVCTPALPLWISFFAAIAVVTNKTATPPPTHQPTTTTL